MHHLSSSLLYVALLSVSTSAAPAKRDGSYSKTHLQSVGSRNTVIAVDRTYRKYGITPPGSQEDVANTAPATTNEKATTGGSGTGVGDVSATAGTHNSEYLCPVTIGGQTLYLDVDTGSSDLWVFNTAMPSNEIGNHTAYNPSQSHSSKTVSGATFGVGYGDNSTTTGNVGTDTVQMGGIVVTEQAVELPTTVSSGFLNDNSDGILGLGFQSINGIQPTAQPTFFENAMSSLAQPVFTANLKDGTAGNYQFGVIDHTAFAGSIAYTPVNNSAGLWSFSTTSYAIGNGATQTNNGSPGIADTGSSLLLLDDAIVTAYWAQVSGKSSDSQGITFPCSTTLPDLHIALGNDYMATISGSLINYAPATQDGYCFGGIQSNTGQGINVFGDIMFRSQFVVFDYGNTQIGFAPHA